jgi:DNA-binding SARP family transcriptional activator
MEFRILGPLAVIRADGHSAVLGGRKPRTLLAALLLARGRVVPDERLISLLWEGDRPSTVDAQLCTYVSRLRKGLGRPARLVRTGGGYLLAPGSGTVDAEEFERLAARGHDDLRAGRAARAAETFRAALELWRGPVLAGVAEPLRAGEAARFEELRLAVLEGRIEAEVASGDHLRAVPDATGLVFDHPLRERARALLMTALCASGRPADAVAVYHRGRRILDERLGIAPGPALRQAYQRVLDTQAG